MTGKLRRLAASLAVVFTGAVTPLASSTSAPSAAQTMAGVWNVVYDCAAGWCAGGTFPDTYTISQAPGSSTFSGTDEAGATLTGTLTGNQFVLDGTEGAYTWQVNGTLASGGASFSGPLSDSNGSSGIMSGTLTGSLVPSVAGVICNLDLSNPTSQATFDCDAFVAAASGSATSTPTGTLTWSATVGSFTSSTCELTAINDGVAGCSVTYNAPNSDVPEGEPAPVSVAYGGDTSFAPSSGSDVLLNGTGLDASELDGGEPNPAQASAPSCGCGDPVDPATGAMSLKAADVVVPGLGLGVALARTYNSDQRSKVGMFGAGWASSYGAHLALSSQAATVTLGDGATVPFGRDGSTFAPATWSTATLRAVSGDYVLTFSNQTTETFDATGRLIALGDRTGEQTALSWVGSHLSKVIDASGRQLRFTTDAGGQIVAVVGPLGRTTRYRYDSKKDLVAVTNVGGGTTTYRYGASHLLTEVRDPEGNVSATTYNTAGAVRSQSDPGHHVLSFAYAGHGTTRLTTITNGDKHRDVYVYQQGLLVSSVLGASSAEPAATSWLYNDEGQEVGVVDPDGSVWRFARDTVGNVQSETDPLGDITTHTYDADNDLTGTVDALGEVDTIAYDIHGEPTKEVLAAGTPAQAVTTFTYVTAHPREVASMTNADGNTWRYRYDRYGDLVSSVDPLGDVTTQRWNAASQLTGVTTPLNHRSTTVLDALGEATRTTDPLGATTTLAHDPDLQTMAQTNASGQTTRFAYDAEGRLTKVSAPGAAAQLTTYDADGNPLGEYDGSRRLTTMTYDAVGRLVAWTAAGGRWHATYDRAGNQTSTTSPTGQVTNFRWNAGDELVEVSYSHSSAPAVSYAYDADGRTISMTDGTGTTTYTYDQQGRLVSTTNGAGSTVSYTYDPTGNVTSITYPNGLVVTRSFDALGRLVAVSDGAHTDHFSYNAAGDWTGSVLGNGVQVTMAANADGYPTAITDATSSTKLASFRYGRNALGEVTSIEDPATNGTAKLRWAPDGALESIGAQRYATDSLGDLAVLDGARATYGANGQVTMVAAHGSRPATSYAYNADGQRTRTAPSKAASASYHWNGASELVSTTTGKSTTTYTYDGRGLRNSATTSGGTSASFTWDLAQATPQLLGNGTDWYVYGPAGLPIEQVGATATLWLLTDQQGSVRAVTNASGAVVERIAYNAYGAVTSRTGPTATSLGYDGFYTDPDGLQDLGARYYDASTAEFLSVDPGLAQSHSAYGFAGGDPVSFDDPTGTGADDVKIACLDAFIDMEIATAPKTAQADARLAQQQYEAAAQVQAQAEQGALRSTEIDAILYSTMSTVYAGHGQFDPNNGNVTVPTGTYITFHSPPNTTLTDEAGNVVEQGGTTAYSVTYGPGQSIPNYTLYPPAGLSVTRYGPTTVNSPANLSTLLKPGMGEVDWAACTSVKGAPSDGSYGPDGPVSP